MNNVRYQQYNTSLKDYGRKNRKQKNMTKAEWLIWNVALKEDKTWFRFLRQEIIKSFILDFYCCELRLGIEIDGSSHNGREEYDEIRSDSLSERGILIIRYRNEDVEKNLEDVIADIQYCVEERKRFLDGQNQKFKSRLCLYSLPS